MNEQHCLLSQDEAARETMLDQAIVYWCAESRIIAPALGYDEADLVELRRVRRMFTDLGLDQPAIEVVIRMRRRMLVLQSRMRHLETELRRLQRTPRTVQWVEAEWKDSL